MIGISEKQDDLHSTDDDKCDKMFGVAIMRGG